MKYILEEEFLKDKNIQIEDEIMENGEEGFRIKLPENYGINVTNASKIPSWQNAHFHKYCKEVYIVLNGKILIATRTNGIINYSTLNKGDEIVIEPNVEHNVYMFEESKTVVVKYGNAKENDWNEAPELDALTKSYKVEWLFISSLYLLIFEHYS